MGLFVFKKYESEGKILTTTKLFYDKYPFKVRVEAGIWLSLYKWLYKKQSNSQFVEGVKQSYQARYNTTRGIPSDEIIADTYDLMKFVYAEDKKFKVRIEGSTVDLYTETAAGLIEVLGTLSMLTSVKIKTLWKPTTTIEKGIMLVKGTPKFLHKATVKAHAKLSIEEKEAVFKYFSNFPESEVKLTKAMTRALTRTNYYADGYFYFNDLSIITFITLMSPSFVNKIFDLVEIKG
jgi:hypothetical protein